MDSTRICVRSTSAEPPAGTCDANQFSNVFTSPNGTVFVVFQNFNNALADAGDNHNQILLVKSEDGGETWSDPVKVADFYDLPDCAEYTGFDAGRACVPTAPLSGTSIFRATNYPSGVATDDENVVVDFAATSTRTRTRTSATARRRDSRGSG